MAEVRIGTSGWMYDSWRGSFYPKGLARTRQLHHLSRQFDSAELNGSFYSLQRPERYTGWRDETPEGFVFAVKGGRFITHMKRLRDVRVPMANFFASGVLALGDKLGPLLWQLPARFAFDAERLTDFFELLPRTTAEAAKLAQEHDDKLKAEAYTELDDGVQRLRHALEVRHPSFSDKGAVELLREHDIALVVSDSAGEWPRMEDVTADFVYVRLHGDTELYASGYKREKLRWWADRIRAWHSGRSPRSECTVAKAAPRKVRDVYVYIDNDMHAHAPHDALTLAELLG